MAVQGTVVRQPWVARAAALAVIGAGIFLLKISVLDVLAAAERREAVSLSMKGTVMAPIFIVLGIVGTWAAFTKEDPRDWGHSLTNPQTKRLTARAWLITIVLLGIGFGLYAWLRSQLAGLGYDV